MLYTWHVVHFFPYTFLYFEVQLNGSWQFVYIIAWLSWANLVLGWCSLRLWCTCCRAFSLWTFGKMMCFVQKYVSWVFFGVVCRFFDRFVFRNPKKRARGELLTAAVLSRSSCTWSLSFFRWSDCICHDCIGLITDQWELLNFPNCDVFSFLHFAYVLVLYMCGILTLTFGGRKGIEAIVFPLSLSSFLLVERSWWFTYAGKFTCPYHFLYQSMSWLQMQWYHPCIKRHAACVVVIIRAPPVSVQSVWQVICLCLWLYFIGLVILSSH